MKKIYFMDKGYKRGISCCSKPLEYLGSEIGYKPDDKVFKIYRDKDEIVALQSQMDNLPITREHIPITDEIINKVGNIISTDLHYEDDEVCLVHKMNLSDEFKDNEFSLGYLGRLEERDGKLYQVDIKAHHLALLEKDNKGIGGKGRCGTTCKLYDEKGSFTDMLQFSHQNKKESNMTLLEMFNGATPEEQTKFIDEAKIQKTVFKDKMVEVPAKVTAEMKKQFGDEAIAQLLDSKEFADKRKQENEAYAQARVEVIEKAKNFLDDGYKFADKSNDAIMSDAVKAELSDIEFADNEIGTAFKTLKVVTQEVAKVEFTDAQKEIQDFKNMEI